MNLVNLNNISYSRRLSHPTCTQMLDSILPNVLEKRGGADKRNDKTVQKHSQLLHTVIRTR